MNKKHNSQLHKLLEQTKLMQEKESLVYAYTSERTSSSREMTDNEAIELIKYLKKFLPKSVPATTPEGDGLRKYIISIFYRKYDAKTTEEKQLAVKLCKEWVSKHFKGDLNSFEAQQLFKIKLAAEKMLRDGAKAVRRAVCDE